MIEFSSWLPSALFGMISFACLTLTLKQLSYSVPTAVILAYGFSFTTILFFLQALRQGVSLRISWSVFALIALSSFFGFLANISDVNALRMAPNAGYATAVKAGQILVVTFVAVLLFPDQKISTQGISGVIFIVVGIGLLALQK
jgi:drug/metabolite transporter (DMT)-like permease